MPMNSVQRGLLRFGCLALLLLAAAAPFADEPVAREAPVFFDGIYGWSTVNVPDITEQGTWDGTWFYVNRDLRFMLWMRHNDAGELEARMQFFRLGVGERFRTDWNGVTRYETDGAPGLFEMKIREANDVYVLADWKWSVEFADSARREEGTLQIVRTGDGRRLSFQFDPFWREIDRFGVPSRIERPEFVSFVKASKRLLRWDELF